MNRETGVNRLRCRPGDLAIVTRCGVPERIGLLVRVIERCTDGKRDWLTRIEGAGVIAAGVDTGRVAVRRMALMDDANLTPIRGSEIQCRMARLDREACEASGQTSAQAPRTCPL